MTMEGRRQFIPRESGDSELTQAELEAQNDGDNRTSRLFKKIGIAAVLGAAALQAEAAPAQQKSFVEKENIQQLKHEFKDENDCKFAMEMLLQLHSDLVPFFEGATVREADPSKAGEPGEKTYYVYLPKYDVVLTVLYNDSENMPRSATDEEVEQNMKKGITDLTVSLFSALRDNGFIDIRRDANGKAELIPRKVKTLTSGTKVPPNWEELEAK